MSNDPDLLDRPCAMCAGEGLVDDNTSLAVLTCPACDGEGVVLR